MNVEAYFTPAALDPPSLAGRTAVVIDVVRATSTMVTALAAGARMIYPTTSSEEAIKLASSLGREDTLLCGERRGLRIEGFDLGNSPAEFSEEVVGGRQLVMTTTNGTRAFVAASGADRVIAASFLNLGAVAGAVSDVERLTVVCAGRENRFSLDDAVCAGHLLRAVQERSDAALETDDAAEVALRLAGEIEPDEEFLRRTQAGAALVEIGLDSDLSLCARLDRYALVPELDDRRVHLPAGRTGTAAQ